MNHLTLVRRFLCGYTVSAGSGAKAAPRRLLRRAAGSALVEQRQSELAHLSKRPKRREQSGCQSFTLADQRQEQMLGTNIIMAEALGSYNFVVMMIVGQERLAAK